MNKIAMHRMNSNADLDSLDLSIIEALEIDARKTKSDLAGQLHVSVSTVQRRLDRLLNKSVIRFAVIADPIALGYHVQATLGIRVRPGTIDEVANKVAKLPGIRNLNVTTGSYDIMAWTFFSDNGRLFDFLNEGLGCISDVLDSETLTIIKVIKDSWNYLADDHDALHTDHSTYVLDQLDSMLIAELELDAKCTSQKLAEKLGIGRMTARDRVQRLLDYGIVRIVSIADPMMLGYTVRAGILMKVELNSIEGVAYELAFNKRIRHVLICTGQYDLMAWGVFRDSDDLYHFLKNELGTIPGIRNHQTVTTMRYIWCNKLA